LRFAWETFYFTENSLIDKNVFVCAYELFSDGIGNFKASFSIPKSFLGNPITAIVESLYAAFATACKDSYTLATYP
jgi:hypothetical protein